MRQKRALFSPRAQLLLTLRVTEARHKPPTLLPRPHSPPLSVCLTPPPHTHTHRYTHPTNTHFSTQADGVLHCSGMLSSSSLFFFVLYITPSYPPFFIILTPPYLWASGASPPSLSLLVLFHHTSLPFLTFSPSPSLSVCLCH